MALRGPSYCTTHTLLIRGLILQSKTVPLATSSLVEPISLPATISGLLVEKLGTLYSANISFVARLGSNTSAGAWRAATATSLHPSGRSFTEPVPHSIRPSAVGGGRRKVGTRGRGRPVEKTARFRDRPM